MSSAGIAAAEFITGKLGINLSNANTPGYKGLGTYLLSETSQYNAGVNAGSRINANIQGEISETKKEFDYAIEGDGFFPLKCGEQIKYTRVGRYELDNQDFIKSPNGRYLLGEAYTDDNQDQVTDIEKANLKPIKLDKNPIKGKATTTADISLSLSAKQMVMGGGNGELIILIHLFLVHGVMAINSILPFTKKNGDNPSQEFEYNFVFNSDPRKSGFNSDTKTVTFDSTSKLATLVNNNLSHFVDFAVDTTDPSKIKIYWQNLLIQLLIQH